MRRWQWTGLVLVAATLFFTARPAQAQLRVGPPVVSPAPPVWVGPPVGPPPFAVGRPTLQVWPAPPVMVARPPIVVSPGWGARPRDIRRAYRAARRGGWYGAAWGPRGGVVVAGRPW
jgi:hypothetical protein